MNASISDETGFTLIELTIATAIVLMLSGLALASFQKFQLRARSSESANLGSIMTSNEAFMAKWGKYVQAKRFPKNCKKGPQLWDAKESGGFLLIGWKATGLVRFCYCLQKGGPESSEGDGDENGNSAQNRCESGKNSRWRLRKKGSTMELRKGITAREGKVDITAILEADLDADKHHQAYYNTDENKEIIPDPYSAGESTF